MRRALVLTGLLAIAAVCGALVYRATARERSYRLLIASGEAALAREETLAAIEDFSGAVTVRPDAMLARLRRGETYRSRGDFDQAARDFRAAATLDPTATRPLEALGDVLFTQERFKRAAEVFQARLQLDDRSAVVRYKLALARYRDGTVESALDEARRALELDANFADAYLLIGLCLSDMGQVADGIVALEHAVDLSPGLTPAREELADLYAKAGRRAEQLEQLHVLAGLDPARVERQIAVGLVQAQIGRPELAVGTLTAALDRAEEPAAVHAALGRVWLQVAEDHPERTDAIARALEALERAASALSATSETKALYGRALMLTGQLEAAEQLFQQAAERYPVDPNALRWLGSVAEELHHPDLARSALVSYCALVQPDAEATAHAMRIATLSLQLDDAPTAVPWLQRAIAAHPDDLAALRLLAEAQLRMGSTAEARVTLTHAMELSPQDRDLISIDRRLRRLGA